MAVPLKSLARRRLANTLVLLAAALGCLLLWRLLAISLRPDAIYSGLALLALVLVLTLFNARKKLPFLPLLKASHWLQFHIYAGLLSILLYGIHTGFRIPNGTLEAGLALLFAIVTLSGVAGLVISRWLPQLMTRSGEPLTYEKIPAYETRLRREVESLVEETEAETGASALGDLYLSRLAGYFRPRRAFHLFLGRPGRFRARAMVELDKTERYIGDDERPALETLRRLVETKHNLDLQKSSQFLLRCWLFLHIPFTYSMLIVALVHAWIALNYTHSR